MGKTILRLCFVSKKINIENVGLESFKEEKLEAVLSDMLDNGSLSYREFLQIKIFLMLLH